MANIPENQPISQPKWLVLFIMHLECEAISRAFQRQPDSEGGWALLCWADRTLAALPLVEDEGEWAVDATIPPFFNFCDHLGDVSYGLLFEMVEKINIFF